jgi:hypothetical protein
MIRRRRVGTWLVALCWGAFAVAQAPEAGDALGAGLTPPTASRYADPNWYDLLDVRWATNDGGTAVLEIELAAIDPDAPLLQPIVDAYLMHPEGAGRATLPGTDLAMPEGVGWTVAVRTTSEGAWAWSPVEGAQASARPLTTAIVGRTVQVVWPGDLTREGAWVAVSGVYDPFSEHGWRPLTEDPSPWAFAGPPGTPPVVSIVPGGDDALLRVHATGRLPRGAVRSPTGPVSAWWWWMAAGLALGVAGLAWRGAAARPPSPPVVAEVAPDAPDAPVAPGVAADPGVSIAPGVAADPVAPAAPSEPVAGRSPKPPVAPEAPAGTAVLIGDDDVAVAAGQDELAPSAADERSLAGRGEVVADTATVASPEAASEDPSDASSSARTTRAPSDASRSANRS